MSWWHLRLAARTLARGGLVLHATEGVWGLACDPWDRNAVARLLATKRRSRSKGLIVMGADASMFEPELGSLAAAERTRVRADWPGAVTWVLPNQRFPAWVTGDRDSIAVRVPGHPQARALASAFGGPLVSTSANRAGRPPPRNRFRARAHERGELCGAKLRGLVPAPPLYLLPGETLGRSGPSEIRKLDGTCLRGGG